MLIIHEILQSDRNDLNRQLRGQTSPKHSLLAEKQQQFLRPLPQQTFEACRLGQAHANSLSLVRFDTNSYSVPTK
ncbi:Mu transposase domain-containing protein [Gimesia sp.]|uniref:Mu transposase domain-containing protein n=1 Tax=Gimesia sp. TaxID=2024833 RepID=UPI003A918B6B